MAINYITIDQMLQKNDLEPTDKILIARSDNSNGYTTYSSTLEILSGAISCDVSEAARKEILVTSFNETARDDKAPSYRLLLSVYTPVQYISAHYLDVDADTTKRLSGDVFFKNSPNIPDIDIDTDETAAVNAKTLKQHTDNVVKARAIGNDCPQSYVYKVVTKNACDYDIYNSQSISCMAILAKTYEKKPIIHRCTADCQVTISGKFAQTPIYMFGFYNENAASFSKNDICTNLAALDWHALGAFTNPMRLVAKKDTFLCFFIGQSWDTTNLKLKPVYSKSFQSGDIIRIDEYQN